MSKLWNWLFNCGYHFCGEKTSVIVIKPIWFILFTYYFEVPRCEKHIPTEKKCNEKGYVIYRIE